MNLFSTLMVLIFFAESFWEIRLYSRLSQKLPPFVSRLNRRASLKSCGLNGGGIFFHGYWFSRP